LGVGVQVLAGVGGCRSGLCDEPSWYHLYKNTFKKEQKMPHRQSRREKR